MADADALVFDVAAPCGVAAVSGAGAAAVAAVVVEDVAVLKYSIITQEQQHPETSCWSSCSLMWWQW